MGILCVDLDKISFHDINFDEDDPETVIHVRLMTWRNSFSYGVRNVSITL